MDTPIERPEQRVEVRAYDRVRLGRPERVRKHTRGWPQPRLPGL